MNRSALKHGWKQYEDSNKSSMDLLSLLNTLHTAIDSTQEEEDLAKIVREISSELIGLTTEAESLKQKIVENATKKAITEYMLSYLSDIETNIINNSKTKLRLPEKIKKMISDYRMTNYFTNIRVITMSDNLIDSVYSEEFSLFKHIKEVLKSESIDKTKRQKLMETYGELFDYSNLNELKIAFRKTVAEMQAEKDLFCDFWVSLLQLADKNICYSLFKSLTAFLSKTEKFTDDFILPLLKESNAIQTGNSQNSYGKYKKVYFDKKEYFIGSIYIIEDNDTKLERFLTQLRALDFKNEADLLHIYITGDSKLLTEKLIREKFRLLPDSLLEELLSLNQNKFKQICIGHVIVSDPTADIYEKEGELNFIIKMLLDSIYKMSEILLINDYEFQEFQKEMLITLQQISQLRDIETARHQDRVTIYTSILATALLEKKNNKTLSTLIEANHLPLDTDYFIIDKEYIRDLLYSASLHDLGKVGIDDSILKSSEKLTEEQFDIMKNHTTYGSQKLSSIVKVCRKRSFLKLAAKLAGNHHERWNGSGYPNSKKAFEIPLSARILSIADVYDALRIKRTYKRTFTHEETFDYIVSQKGKCFDPVLIDIFIENHEKFAEAFQKV